VTTAAKTATRGATIALVTLALTMAASAQSSSLYVEAQAKPPARYETINGVADRLSPYVAQASIAAVRLPEPHQFTINDLVTIIVRESIEAESDSELTTEKDASVKGLISAFPNLNVKDLINLQLDRATMDGGNPEVDITLGNQFEGEGEYERSDSFTTRLTSRIIDIKPNGTLVLEARKFIQSDDETVNIILTGTARKEDVTADNTILSTQIYDLQLVKKHSGELRKASKKGLVTKFFEMLFNF
jgi:flagellar L-ring protein precursor FlgH